ncbi:MAG: YebC/PmpR family DNA-binding transcriptional regulator [Candidatus Moranbacteria bacterium]|nr:YebC/PmpR family DNA-binding transcriptional regulator [Candidatus Moranbacteria bacterium]
MSGHSHWATTHRQKDVNDAKRAAVFTKYGRNIIVAAQHGGGNPDTNFALRLAIDQARTVNMPKDNIDRAIKRGTGELKDGATIEDILYEGYLPVRSLAKAGGPDNVAMLIQTTTDNRNRTVSEIKSLFTKANGKIGAIGSVAFLFKQVGEIIIDHSGKDRDTAELDAIDAGAEDTEDIEENILALYVPFENLKKVKDVLEEKGYAVKSAGLSYRPIQTVALDAKAREQYDAFFEQINDHPDVQRVWDNLE